jgi:spore germination cell wall hydrolase CwlJ-like protein
VSSATDPLIASASATIPEIVTPVPMDAPTPALDQLADPLVEDEAEAADAPEPEKDLATLVAEMRSADPGSRELECLAVGIYFESKGEPLTGQLAVGEVIANRAESPKFPSTYCGVLFQRKQFSFIRGKSLPRVNRSSRAWKTAVAVAKIVDQDLKDSAADNALFFHARRVSPGWKLKRVASIGNHIFYR